MAQKAIHPRRMPGWLHDDCEEDLVGADWHQDAIRELSTGLKNLARTRQLSWHVGDQLTLVATRPDGSVWRPSPDVMIHPTAGPEKRAELGVIADGLPTLIIEVASPSTWEYDIDMVAGKAWGYLQLDVSNYLVFDPRGDLLREPCRGWQIDAGMVHDWRPRADGRYHVTGLSISFAPEGNLLRSFDRDGQPAPFTFELSRRIAELEAENATLRDRSGREE